MNTIQLYEKESGQKCPENQIAYTEWYGDYVTWLEKKVEEHIIKPMVPAVRVRFHPKDTDETYDGAVIEETQYSYLVIPDDNLAGTARWNKKCCEVLR